MRIRWWQAGIHITPETAEEGELLDNLLAALKTIKVGSQPHPDMIPGFQRGNIKGVVAVDEPLEMTENAPDVPGGVVDDP